MSAPGLQQYSPLQQSSGPGGDEGHMAGGACQLMLRWPGFVQSSPVSVVSDSATPWTAARQASLSITNSRSLLTHVHRVSDAIQPSHPLRGLTGWISLQAKELSESLLQHQNSEASILQHSDFFIIQLSHPYMTTRKTIALTRWTFVGNMSLLLICCLGWRRLLRVP